LLLTFFFLSPLACSVLTGISYPWSYVPDIRRPSHQCMKAFIASSSDQPAFLWGRRAYTSRDWVNIFPSKIWVRGDGCTIKEGQK
jgi:hypothetical protein